MSPNDMPPRPRAVVCGMGDAVSASQSAIADTTRFVSHALVIVYDIDLEVWDDSVRLANLTKRAQMAWDADGRLDSYRRSGAAERGRDILLLRHHVHGMGCAGNSWQGVSTREQIKAWQA
jgi:hypothetical protein